MTFRLSNRRSRASTPTQKRSTEARSKPSISNTGCHSSGSRSATNSPKKATRAAPSTVASKVAGMNAATACTGRAPMLSG